MAELWALLLRVRPASLTGLSCSNIVLRFRDTCCVIPYVCFHLLRLFSFWSAPNMTFVASMLFGLPSTPTVRFHAIGIH